MLCTRSDGRSGSDTTTVQLMIKSSQGKERIAALFIIKLYHWTPPPCLRVCLAKCSLAFLRLQYKSEFDTWQVMCHPIISLEKLTVEILVSPLKLRQHPRKKKERQWRSGWLVLMIPGSVVTHSCRPCPASCLQCPAPHFLSL